MTARRLLTNLLGPLAVASAGSFAACTPFADSADSSALDPRCQRTPSHPACQPDAGPTIGADGGAGSTERTLDFVAGYAASAWSFDGKSVVHVTNLEDSGAGSFRDAVSTGNRVVLFDVGGIIEAQRSITIAADTVVAAFTAPGEAGIIIRGATVVVAGDNVAVVGLKVWHDFLGETDAIQVNRASNVLVAYGSFLFATDEVLSTFAGGTTESIEADNITFFGNIAVGGNTNHHAAGGMMNGKGVDKVDYIQNVAAFNQIRSFRFAGAVAGVEQRGNQWNCVTYAWLNQANESSGTPAVNVIGNYFKRGPRNSPKAGIHNEGGRIYIADNNDDSTTGEPGWTEVSVAHPVPYDYEALSAEAAYEKLISTRAVGWKNTALEHAILEHVANGTMPDQVGDIDGIVEVAQLGGWPSIVPAATTHEYSDIEVYLESFFASAP